jgi:hypothetical protein
MGERHEVPGIERILTEARDALDSWPEFAARADVDTLTTDRIARDLTELRPN